MMLKVLESVLYITVHVCGHKNPKIHVYLMVPLYISTVTIAIIWEYYVEKRLFIFVTASTMLYCLYAAPNFKWFCGFMSVYTSASIVFSILYGDFNDPEFNLMLGYQAGYGLVGLFLFHITCSQRLYRFFSQEKYKN